MKTATAIKLQSILSSAAPKGRDKAPTIVAEDPRAERIAALKRQLVSLETEYAQLADSLVADASALLSTAEGEGRCVKTVDYGACRVVRNNRARPLGAEPGAALRLVLGARTFDELFTLATTAKLRDAMVDALLAHLGADAGKYLDVGAQYVPSKTWIEDRAALRPRVGVDANGALDVVSASLLNKPSITVK